MKIQSCYPVVLSFTNCQCNTYNEAKINVVNDDGIVLDVVKNVVLDFGQDIVLQIVNET